jgi:hypothetical protein
MPRQIDIDKLSDEEIQDILVQHIRKHCDAILSKGRRIAPWHFLALVPPERNAQQGRRLFFTIDELRFEPGM